MNLRDIIEATLIGLDRGTAPETVEMYKEKFTRYANEAVNEIARRFKMATVEEAELTASDPTGAGEFDTTALSHACKRVVNVFRATEKPDTDPVEYTITDHDYKRPLYFYQDFTGRYQFMAVKGTEQGEHVFVEYRFVPTPMNVSSLDPEISLTPDEPELPVYMHDLIPMYVRAREQCGQDPSTQGTSSAFFSLFDQAVYNLQRETMAAPESFKLLNYHFE